MEEEIIVTPPPDVPVEGVMTATKLLSFVKMSPQTVLLLVIAYVLIRPEIQGVCL